VGAWVGTGAASGAIVSGVTTALNGGSLSETIVSVGVGGAIGAVAGAAGNRVAVGSAARAARSGAGAKAAIKRGDRFGSLGGALSGLGMSGLLHAASTDGNKPKKPCP